MTAHRRRRGRPAGRRNSTKPQAPAISPEQRERLLKELRDGLDPEAASIAAGLPLDVVLADAECERAYKLVTGRLRAKNYVTALKDANVHILERAILERQETQKLFRSAMSGATENCDIDWDKLSEFQLDCAEAVADGLAGGTGWDRLEALIEQRARAMAADIARDMLRRTDPTATVELNDNLGVLDQARPIRRDHAMVPMSRRAG